MQNWFSGGGDVDNNPNLQPKTTSSLLADWNSYATTQASSDTGSGSLVGSFDIESAVRSANDTVSGTFNV